MARTVLVVLLLIAGDPANHFGAAYFRRRCSPDTEIKNPLDEELIEGKNISGNRRRDSITVYIVPKEDFKGARAELRHSRGTVSAWFPIKDRCHINKYWWWKLLLKVQKNSNSQVTLTLQVFTCKLTCEVSIDRQPGGERKLKLRGLKLFGRGPSKWKERRPYSPCSVIDIPSTNVPSISFPSCTKPPHHGNSSTPHPSTGHNTEWPTINATASTTPPATPPATVSTTPPATPPATSPTTASTTPPTTPPTATSTTPPATSPTTASTTPPTTPPTTTSTTSPATSPTRASTTPPTKPSSPSSSSEGQTQVLSLTVLWVVVSMVIVVIMIVMAVVFRMVMRGRKRQDDVITFLMREPGPDTHATTNSMYEPLDKYLQHSDTAGNGGATRVTTNSLHEPFHQDQQHYGTAGHCGVTHSRALSGHTQQ